MQLFRLRDLVLAPFAFKVQRFDSRQVILLPHYKHTGRPVLGGNASSEVRVQMVGADIGGSML